MSDKLRESVSALVDGEVSAMELRRILASTNSAEVRDRWKAYQLTRGALAGDSLQFAHIDLSVRVGAALDVSTPIPEESAFSWRKSLGGLAVAATVAAVVVVGGQNLQSGGERTLVADAAKGRVYPAPAPAAPVARDGALSAEFSGISPASAVDPDGEAELRLERFLLQHTERAAVSSGQGMISFARVPAVETQIVDNQ